MAEDRQEPMALDFCSRSKIGTRLRDLRNENNYTQTTVAQMMGISNSALSQYEACKRVPDYELLCKLAQLYDVSTDYLLGMTDFRIHFVEHSTVRKEIEGIGAIRKHAPELFEMLVELCQHMNTEQLGALTAVVKGYVGYFTEKDKKEAT